MNTHFNSGTELLTIGELAARTDVAPATLRMWEQRHGFPVPERLPSGHRRYRGSDVPLVQEVARRRDEGVRLDMAVAQVVDRAREAGGDASVYAGLRARHPHLQAHRLRKATLKALSWAIEDEFCAKATRPHLFGAFQREEFYAPSRARWQELAKLARSSTVFVDAPAREQTDAGDGGPVTVALPDDSPVRREWVVVCDSPELPAALAAFELPGQEGVADRDRVFESVWTVEPAVVRDAARTCAGVAHHHGSPDAGRVLYELAEPVGRGVADLAAVSTLFNRVVAYVDHATDPSRPR